MGKIYHLGCAFIYSACAIVPTIAVADPSQVVKFWRTDAGWLTELRQHADGARVCTTGKAFKESRPFGSSIVKSGPVTLITLVDEGQPPSQGGQMTFGSGGETFGNLTVTPAGPAFATTEEESERTWNTISRLPAQTLSIGVAGREYAADLAGIEQARDQLKACEKEAEM